MNKRPSNKLIINRKCTETDHIWRTISKSLTSENDGPKPEQLCLCGTVKWQDRDFNQKGPKFCPDCGKRMYYPFASHDQIDRCEKCAVAEYNKKKLLINIQVRTEELDRQLKKAKTSINEGKPLNDLQR